MKVVYLCLYLLPTLSVVALTGLVVRAFSIRIVWREPDVRALDDEPAES